MSKHIITDFKDLRDAIEAVSKSQPAQTQYERQAEKMGYMQEAESKPEDDTDKKDAFAKRDDHAGEEDIIKGYKALGDKALTGSVEYRRKLLQKELAKMGFKTYSKYAFDSIFKFEGNMQEVQLGKNMLMRDFPNVWATKDSKLYRILKVQIDVYGFTTLLKSYKKDRKKFVDSLKKLAKSPAAQQRAGMGAKDMQYINKPKKGQSFWSQFDDDVDLDEGKMSDLLIDIQQGATAKEIARDFKIPLSVAKNFLKDYYGTKKGSRKEDIEEGKYLKYSDLLLKKSRELDKIDKETKRNPNYSLNALKAINKEIEKEKKKLGISEENIQEGTWAIPDSYKKLYNLQVGFLETKKPATKANAKKMAKDLFNLFGDDALFDDLYTVEKGEDTETKDLRDILKKHLEMWGIRIKPQGARYQITHAPQKWLDNMTANPADEDVDETAKRRKTGNIKKSGLGAKKKVKFKVDKDDKLVSLKVVKSGWSKEERLKEQHEHAKQSPFKLKSQAYPRAVAVNTDGFGKRHATVQDIIDACDSFGMITDKELQVEQIQKQLGKEGFISYKASELQDVFEDRETQRMIYALESLTEEQKPVEYYRDEIEDAYIMSEEIEFVKPDGQKTAGRILKLCENTFNVKDKYTGKSFTYKYIKEEGVNKVKTFREITTITEGRFSKKLVRMAGGIAFDKRYVGGNMTGAVKAIEKLKKGLSDDPQVRDMLRLANESFNNEFYNSMSEDEKTEYQKFFMKALKKFGVSSPTELDDAKKKEFFDYVDKNWTGKKEEKESVSKKEEVPTDSKIDGRRKNFREKMRKLGYIKGR